MFHGTNFRHGGRPPGSHANRDWPKKKMPREGVIVGLAGLMVSAILIAAGTILLRRVPPDRRRVGILILAVGALALAASAGWLVLGVYIDAVTR